MLDFALLTDQIRAVLSAAVRIPLTAAEIFERLPCRDSLLVECARRSDAFEAHELATKLISELLLKQLAPEVHFQVIEGNGLAIDLGDALLTTNSGMVVVYRLQNPTARATAY